MKTIHLLFLFMISLLHPFNGYAFKDECRKTVNVKKYLYKGDFDNKSPAEKIYNFVSIRNDLKNELVSKEKIDPKKVNCLNDLYQKGIDDAAKYWGARGRSEECLTKDEIPKTRPAACNEKTWREFRKSRKYLTSLQEEKKKMLLPLAEAINSKPEECLSGGSTPQSLEEIAKVAEATKTNLCCGTPQDKLGVVKTVYPDLSHQQCLDKITDSSNVIKGIALCGTNVIVSAIKAMWNSLKSAISFLTSPSQIIGAMSAVKELATNEKARELFAKKIKESVNQFISTRSASFNNCLNANEKITYMCEVTGTVIGNIVDVGGIFKIVKALRAGTVGTEIAALLSKSQSGQKVLSAMKKAENFTGSTIGKAKTAVKESAEKVVKVVAKDARAFALAASLLKKDVGFDEQLLKQMKKADNNAQIRRSSIATEPPRLSGSSPSNVPDAPKVDAPASNSVKVADSTKRAPIGNDARAAVLSEHLDTTRVSFDQQLAKQLKRDEDNAINLTVPMREPVKAPVALETKRPDVIDTKIDSTPPSSPKTDTVGNDARGAALSEHLDTTRVSFDQQLAKQSKRDEDNAIKLTVPMREPVKAPVALKTKHPDVIDATPVATPAAPAPKQQARVPSAAEGAANIRTKNVQMTGVKASGDTQTAVSPNGGVTINSSASSSSNSGIQTSGNARVNIGQLDSRNTGRKSTGNTGTQRVDGIKKVVNPETGSSEYVSNVAGIELKANGDGTYRLKGGGLNIQSFNPSQMSIKVQLKENGEVGGVSMQSP
jgi:hypothetical protein